jgi:hypothetical protein
MHEAFGIKVADVGDLVIIVDPNSSQYGATAPVVEVSEYQRIGEVWYLCQMPSGTFPQTRIDADLDDTLWVRSTAVQIVLKAPGVAL